MLAHRCLFPALLGLVLHAGATSAQECVDYRNFLRFAGRAASPGRARHIAVADSCAYVTRDSGLCVIDVSHPNAPAPIGALAVPAAMAIAVAGSRAYVTDDSTGLLVIDTSLPARPRIVSHVLTPGVPTGVAVLGSHAYVADWYSGLHVIDLADSLSPAIVGTAVIPGVAVSVAAAGDHAYVTSLDSLLVVDVSAPASPRVIGRVRIPHSAIGVAVAGSYAYVAGGGLHIVDVSDPTSPVIVGFAATHNANDVTVAGPYAYVFNNPSLHAGGNLSVIDVSHPASPQVVGSYGTAGYGDATVAAPYAYIADDSGLSVVDIAHPASPPVVARLATPGRAIVAIGVSAPLACVADLDGIQVIDASNPESPTLLGRVDAGTSMANLWDVAVEGLHAYAIDDWVHFEVISIADPASPTVVGAVEMPDQPRALAVAGTIACVAGLAGLHVIDVSNPAAPNIIGGISTPGVAEGVAVVGSYACVVGGLWQGPDPPSGSLVMVDISNPSSPTTIGHLSTPGETYHGVVGAGRYVYVAASESGLQVVDVADPTAPVIIRRVQLPGVAQEIALVGKLAYVASAFAGLQVVDVTNPGSAVLLGGSGTPGWGTGVALAGSYVYVTDGDLGLQVVPGQCEQTPVLLEVMHAFQAENGFLVTWRFSSQGLAELAGVAVERATSEPGPYVELTPAPLAPQIDMQFLDAGAPPGGPYWYRLKVSTSAGEIDVTRSVRASGSWPRFVTSLEPPIVPGRGGPVVLGFRLGCMNQNARLEIFSVEGRLVRTLAAGPRAPGRYVELWDRRDGSGNTVARGVYVVRLRADRNPTRKVVLANH